MLSTYHADSSQIKIKGGINIRKSKHEQCNSVGTAFARRFSDGDVFRISSNAYMLENNLYEALRVKVPVIDACICKIVRLVGDFKVIAEDKRYQKRLDEFCANIPVNLMGTSLGTFIDTYLDSLLTYGKAIGEIVVNRDEMCVKSLYNADSSLFRVRYGDTPSDIRYFVLDHSNEIELKNSQNIVCTSLNPSPSSPEGTSILRGLPCLSKILTRIYECIGQNFDRVGNVRYAVTYKPTSDSGDKAFAKERAMQIASEWSDGMSAARSGVVKDFVAVGDVDIKVIGADNQIIDTEIPVRQLLEQIVSKLTIPPFLLGLNWSSTERMSSQQVDILTSELEYYRRLLTPVITRTAKTFLLLEGCASGVEVVWSNINLQDETELAKARLYNAQAEQIELANEQTKGEMNIENRI